MSTNVNMSVNSQSSTTSIPHSTQNQKADRHFNLLLELNSIYRKKNADYGDSFHDTFLEEGFAMSRIRLTDKLNRFKSLTKKRESEQQVKDESIRDTLMDLANYAIMTILEMEATPDPKEDVKKYCEDTQVYGDMVCPIKYIDKEI